MQPQSHMSTKSLKNIIPVVKKYILNKFPIVIFLWICIALPIGLSPSSIGVVRWVRLWLGFTEGLFPAVILVMLAGLPVFLKPTNRKITDCILIAFSVIAFLTLAAEVAVKFVSGVRFCTPILRIILQSNPDEAREFLSVAALQFPLSKMFLLLALPPVASGVCSFIVKKSDKIKRFLTFGLLFLSLPSGAVFAYCHLRFSLNDIDTGQSGYSSPMLCYLVFYRPSPTDRLRSSTTFSNRRVYGTG